MGVIDFLDQHSGAVMAVLTLAYVLTTLLIFWANYRAVREMRSARIASVRPNLAVYLDAPDGGIAFLVVENKGLSTAYHVRVRFPKEFGRRLDELRGERSEHSFYLGERILSLLERGSLVVAPGQKYYYAAFPLRGLYDHYKVLGEVEGEVLYDWELGKNESSRFFLDFRVFEGGVVPPSEYLLLKDWKDLFKNFREDVHWIRFEIQNYLRRLVDRFAPPDGEFEPGDLDKK